LAIAATIALATELLRQRDPRVGARFEAVFGHWLKPHERREITGATWLLFAMLGAALFFPAPAARAAIWAGVVGDAAAAIVGTAVRNHRRAAAGKSIAGAMACAATTAAGVWWLAPTSWGIAAALGAVAAVAEWPARFGDDNARVTLLTGVAAWALGVG
jgi:dolichol kinase